MSPPKDRYEVTWPRIAMLIQNLPNHPLRSMMVFLLTGILLSPITMIGVMWGYIRAYNRFFAHERPYKFPIIAVVSMAIFGVLIWVLIFLGIKFVMSFYGVFFDHLPSKVMMSFLAGNLVISIIVFLIFRRWQTIQNNVALERMANQDARYALPEERKEYSPMKVEAELMAGRLVEKLQIENPVQGIYIGDGLYYNKQGHLLTCGATRSGKFVSLIVENLLNKYYRGSWLVIDPKGEAAYVTAMFQRSIGRRVLILDPWGKHPDGNARYNPLDLLIGSFDIEDDAMVIAEMIVPNNDRERDKFWSDRARSIIAGILIQIVLTERNKTLSRLWAVLRMSQEDFAGYAQEMSKSENEVVRNTANEIMSMSINPKSFASIMATALQHTDFITSPALRKSMAASSFNINDLTDGNTTLYVIIPADKLKSHYRWLRLIVTTAMRSVVRNSTESRVTFIMDEFASLGEMREISEVGLSLYSGYNLSLWTIFHNLSQLEAIYKTSWSNFIANTAVQHYIRLADNFSAKYISEKMGMKVHITYDKGTGNNMKTTVTPLASMDQLQQTQDVIMFVDEKAPFRYAKQPYYTKPHLMALAEPNPFFQGDRGKFIRKGTFYWPKDKKYVEVTDAEVMEDTYQKALGKGMGEPVIPPTLPPGMGEPINQDAVKGNGQANQPPPF